VKVVYKWWATLVFAVVVVQIGLAGYGAFYVVSKTDNGGTVDEDTMSKGFDPHVAWGYLVVGLSMLIFLIIGLIAGVGRWRLGRHGLLFGLFILQVALAIGGYSAAAIGFFHPVNALVIFAVSGSLLYSVWRGELSRAEPAPPEPTPTPTPTTTTTT
jgi:4-amino-4-deoxy-L-arabinose transferase-like glycosyltransferase